MSEANKFSIPEEKITAYALGELSDSERQDIELKIQLDPALRTQVKEIQDFASQMTAEFAKEPVFKLIPGQRDAVLSGRAPSKIRAFMKKFTSPKALGLEFAMAALFLIVISYKDQIGTRMNSVQAPAGTTPQTALAPVEQKGNVKSAEVPASLAANSHQVLSDSYAPMAKDVRISGVAGSYAVMRAKSAIRGGVMAEGARSALTMMPEPRDGASPNANTEAYDRIEDNAFKNPTQDPLSTFSIDVDTASYTNLRRYLNQGAMPPKDAVRIEEMVNYFTYSYPQPTGDAPFSVTTEISAAPWSKEHRLMKIGLKGRVLDEKKRPPANLVFLVDVSGSMEDPAKLPLLRQSFKLLVEKLDDRDRISMVTYASGTQVVLPPTSGNQKDTIISALDRLVAGGSTNGEGGIQLAYKAAQDAFIKGGSNRVILATDGDFNVGVTDQGSLTRMIEEKAKNGVYLSVLGFGMGNYKDSTLEKLSAQGNGNYAYIDTINEAKKVLVEQMGGTLFTIAKDVKLQLEFNPAEVNAYRLIGYENRLLRHEDFNDDKKDAGDIGAGHTVTAIYEIVPKGVAISTSGVDALKYQQPKVSPPVPSTAVKGEILTLKLRYKQPDSDTSKLLTHVVKDEGKKLDQTSSDFRWAAAVAGFGMILRESQYKGDANIPSILDLAQGARGNDEGGYRSEMIELMKKARSIPAPQPSTTSPVTRE